jgi:sugar-specific transcriptional regulator TrmB
METEILKSLGLIENEIKVYLLLLKRGPSLASEIAEETNLHRTHAYDIINSLIKKSIISYVIRENRKYFQAVAPEHLESLLKDKQEELRQSEEKLKSLITELKEISSHHKPNLLVSVYEGQRGFKALLEDILRKKQDYLVLGYNPTAEESLKYFLPGFYKDRIKAKIKRRAIIDPRFRGSDVEEQRLQEIKFLNYGFPMGIIIYGERVVMTIIQETGQIAVVIENQKFADNFAKLFEQMWHLAKK